MEALPREVRAARAFLYQRGITANKIPPRRFAGAAKEMGVSFKQLLQLLAKVLKGGQSQQDTAQQIEDNELLKEELPT